MKYNLEIMSSTWFYLLPSFICLGITSIGIAGEPKQNLNSKAKKFFASLPSEAIGAIREIVIDPRVQSKGLSIDLKKNVKHGKITCRGGMPLVLADEVWWCALAEPASFMNHKLKAGSSLTYFYERSQIKGLDFSDFENPPALLQVDKVACKEFIHFTKAGHLAGCRLAKGQEFSGGILLKPGTYVEFNETGQLVQAVLYEPHNLLGKDYSGGMLIFKHGKLSDYLDGYSGD